MEYNLRIARRRPQGGVDTDAATFDALTIEAAIARAAALTEELLGGLPGVAVLDSPVWGIVWSHRYRMPAPPEP
ncbi:hypothetical protein ACRAWG_17060 [Methylobacterium sp. P31]